MRNRNFNEKHNSIKLLILLLIDTHFHKFLGFLLMVNREVYSETNNITESEEQYENNYTRRNFKRTCTGM